MDLNSERKWECPKCSKTFKHKYSLNKHVVTHDPNAKMKCKICGKVSKNPVALAAHVTRFHTNRERPKCDICPASFGDSRTLRRHKDVMHGSRERSRFPCTFPACEKTFLNKSSILEHVKTEHAENPVRYPCTLCGKEFKRKTNLDIHIASHTTEKPLNCTTCGKSFARVGDLKRHEEIHLETSARRSFACKLCPLTFFSPSYVGRHVRVVHGNERNHPCTFCGIRFSTSSHLKRHVERKHPPSMEKIHSCDKCEYKSHSKDDLTKHTRRHDPKRSECYFCGKKYVDFQDLVSHCGGIHTLENK